MIGESLPICWKCKFKNLPENKSQFWSIIVKFNDTLILLNICFFLMVDEFFSLLNLKIIL